MLCNGSEEKLFSKSVPISIRNEYTNHLRPCHLFLTMEWQDAPAGMYSNKVLSICLTDENDPFFLYTLNVSGEDFHTLKTNQDLNINFVEFPQHIIAYINKCLDAERSQDPKQYLLIFTLNENLGNVASSPIFDIMETNQFKNVTYLSLKFVRPPESVIKQHIITLTAKIKGDNQQLQNRCSYLEQEKESQLMNYQQTLNRKDQELKSLKIEMDDKLSMKESKHEQELEEERERFHNRLKENESRYERERREKDDNHIKEIQALESKASALDELNKDLEKKNSKLESAIRELRLKIISLEDEAKDLKHNVQLYEEKYQSMHSEVLSKQSHIRELDSMINNLQEKLRSKDQHIDHLIEENEKEKELKKKLEEKTYVLKRLHDTSERSVKSLSRDKEDLNGIVLNLKDKMKKLKSTVESNEKYKLISEEKEKMLQDVKNENLDLCSLLESKTTQIKSLNDEVNCLKDEMAKLKEKIHQQTNIIQYLNRQLAENCITPNAFATSTSPSIVAQKELAKIASSVTMKSTSPVGHSPPVITANKTSAKSVRITTPSQNGNRTSSIPSQFHRTDDKDSAYYTSPSSLGNQMTPETLSHPNKPNTPVNPNPDLDKDFDTDTEALSAAFGNSNPFIKHSTAKKATKSAKSTPSRIGRKR